MAEIVKNGLIGVLPGKIFLDDQFTEDEFKNANDHKFSVIHVASHFRFSSGTEANSFLLLGNGAQLTLGEIRSKNFRFDNVDLLTLSACDTALGGRDSNGKEIEGFGAVAKLQGAKTVIASLWAVEDQSTAHLMSDLYRRHQSLNLSKVESLRQAQFALESDPKYSHPFYWASFIMMGDGS